MLKKILYFITLSILACYIDIHAAQPHLPKESITPITAKDYAKNALIPVLREIILIQRASLLDEEEPDFPEKYKGVSEESLREKHKKLQDENKILCRFFTGEELEKIRQAIMLELNGKTNYEIF